MMHFMYHIVTFISFISCQFIESDLPLPKCPENWVQYENSCYRFIRSPIRPRADALRNCQAYDAELLNINNMEEHKFIVQELMRIDPQHRRWYVSGRQQSPNYWVNEGDGTSLSDLNSIFLPESSRSDFLIPNRDFLAYSYTKVWGLEKVSGDDFLTYICEAPFIKLSRLVAEERSFSYGIDIEDSEKIPRGPHFIKQPENVVYDLQNSKSTKDVSMTCLAGGYPPPTYEWYKEEYEGDKLISKKIEPLTDKRYTLSGGSLIINNPKQMTDRGTYFCKATNKYGSIISESVLLSFGFIGEFNLKRAPEWGNQNWGKVIFCDPPEYYPNVQYHWSRNRFPEFVEEDKRVFVSFDGALYFSALELVDQGNYSCNVFGEDKTSSMGRNGPVFPLTVNPYPNAQQLQIANNFPKVFPEAPIAGRKVRLECVAFGYPVPSYNWTRKGSPLPKNSQMMNYNRVLMIPDVRMEDQGEYVCRINNDYDVKEASIILSVQAEPNFTIPLTDRHMDIQSDLVWTCEAFGVPDVQYKWYRNGEPLISENLPQEDSARFIIQDNILTIKYLNPDRDQAMYQCRAQNTLKTRFSSAQLRILSMKPTFRRRPLDSLMYAGEGDKITIFCNPEAAPKPKFTWRKDEYVIGNGGPKLIVDGNLTISPVSRADAGIYTCIAENQFGVDKVSGRLTVLRLPVFTESLPVKINCIVSQDIGLRCTAISEELLDIAYIWTHNGLKLHTTTNMYSVTIVNGGSLTIYNVSFANAGDYECQVKTVVGSIFSRTTIVVDGPPSSPGGVQVHEVIKKTITLRWTDGSRNGRSILYYIVSARSNWNYNWVNITENARKVDFQTDRKEITLEDVVTPWASYEFRLYAVNELGISLPSEISPQYNIPPDKPYIYPLHISGGGGKIGDLTITWKPLAPQDQNGPGIFYKVFWRRRGAEKEFAHMILKNYSKDNVAIIQIPQEFFYMEYDVKVQAANDIGYGPESPIVTIFSAEDIPHVQPQQPTAYPFNSTAVNASWAPVLETRENIRGKLIGYRLKYWKADLPEDTAVYYLSRSTKPWALIVGLHPDTNYYIKVLAYNGAGAGPESERILERTYRKAPQNPPTSVFVKGINPSSIRVVWRYVAPNADEEPVSGFKVRVWPMGEDISRAVDTIVPIGTTSLEAIINHLSPGKRYDIRVLAFSNGGDGRMSSPTVHIQMGHEESFINSSTKIPRNMVTSVTILLVAFFIF